MEQAYQILYTGALIVLAVLLFLCLYRAVRGPRVADRIMGVNMCSTLVTIMIAVLTLMLSEGYLADVAIIYAMLGFLAVVLLTKVYMGIYQKKKQEEEKKNA